MVVLGPPSSAHRACRPGCLWAYTCWHMIVGVLGAPGVFVGLCGMAALQPMLDLWPVLQQGGQAHSVSSGAPWLHVA